MIQKTESWFTDNNKSAILMVTYGDCKLLLGALNSLQLLWMNALIAGAYSSKSRVHPASS